MPGRKQAQLDRLRARIAALETHPVLAGAEAARREPPPGLLATAPGQLHEVFATERRHGGAALGFALAQARAWLTPQRPALLIMQIGREAQDMGLPYGAGLDHFGLDPDAVVLTRTETMAELLWAIEEAVGCHAVAAVVADIAGRHRRLDFTASRRLSLRAAAAGTSVLLLRYGHDREASAAGYRWRIDPVPSRAAPFDARAPAGPRWRVWLEKGRLAGGGRADGGDWILDWTEDGYLVVDGNGTEAAPAAAGTALPGAPAAALGDRLPETG